MTRRDFGYDLQAWHDHLKESREGGYTYGRNIKLPKIMQAALDSPQWRAAVKEIRGTATVKLYHYVGPKEIRDRVSPENCGFPIRGEKDVRDWIRTTEQGLVGETVVATYIVDPTGCLRIADRRSEHVACAGGKPVRSAGEMTFHVGDSIEVMEVSNQSTGYCPETESFPAVADALDCAGLSAPSAFTPACNFRRCLKCEAITLVKEQVFECGMCGAVLPAEYNVQGFPRQI